MKAYEMCRGCNRHNFECDCACRSMTNPIDRFDEEAALKHLVPIDGDLAFISVSGARWQFENMKTEVENYKQGVNYNQSVIQQRNDEIDKLTAENTKLRSALNDCIEAFEGIYGVEFWESPFGQKHIELKYEGGPV